MLLENVMRLLSYFMTGKHKYTIQICTLLLFRYTHRCDALKKIKLSILYMKLHNILLKQNSLSKNSGNKVCLTSLFYLFMF